ncbi:MAG: membrane-bound O-acyltransferase family protein [Planctomycetota bacterium]|nr:MAG: membrane-bound O-acyltransferase family protein [Planctomycetota bacterium]
MLFNSYIFILFFIIIFLIYNIKFPWKIKKIILLIGSYIFYAAWIPSFTLILIFSTLVDWLVAKRIFSCKSTLKRRIYLCVSLTSNLGLLFYFKYSQFAVDSYIELNRMFGIEISPMQLGIILPIGISFYTFQTLSYTFDIYLKRMEPTKSILDFALFVSFFPQLVAGPIVRANNFLIQCISARIITFQKIGWGVTLFIYGLFLKSAIADGIFAPLAEQLYSSHVSPLPIAAWTGTISFAGQIFCDFAGYSTCAIGLAMILGFELPDNFARPYGALGFSDFWRRWHISLSTWLRDYLYIPLGGSRKGKFLTYRNLLITMVLGGLWHGAAWNFLIWGLLHGLLLMIERLSIFLFKGFTFWKSIIGKSIIWIMTFSGICFTWVFFRADDFTEAYGICLAMIGLPVANAKLSFSLANLGLPMATMLILVLFHIGFRNKSLEELGSKIHWSIRGCILAMMLISIFLIRSKSRAFIYFQF